MPKGGKDKRGRAGAARAAPSSLWSLGASFYASLELADVTISTGGADTVAPSKAPATLAATAGTAAAEIGCGCTMCGCLKFSDVARQRAHFRSDWHRCNLRRACAEVALPPLGEEVFNAIVLGEDSDLSSISASDDEPDDESAGEHSAGDDEYASTSKYVGGGAGGDSASTAVRAWEPRITFVQGGVCLAATAAGVEASSDAYTTPPRRVFTLWRAVLCSPHERGELSPLDMRDRVRALAHHTCWAVLLCRGGHFAGAVFKNGEVVVHKTFHRYVVRQGQGGRQSEQDAKGNAPKSAGSSLRRYNEAALAKEIGALLREWAAQLAECELIWADAPGTNAKSLFQPAGSKHRKQNASSGLLPKTDRRIRAVPFTTARPTLNEAKRVLLKLCEVRLHAEKPATGAAGEGEDEDAVTPEPELEPEPELMVAAEMIREEEEEEEEEEEDEVEGTELYRAVHCGDVARVKAALEAENTCTDFLEQRCEGAAQQTALHLAALSNHAPIIELLLIAGADPAPAVRGKTAYALCTEKAPRNAFRRRFGVEPDAWDWVAAGVPSPLTADAADDKRRKKKEKEKRRKAARRKEKEDAKLAEEAREQKSAAEEAAMLDAAVAQAGTEKARVADEKRGAALAAKLQREEYYMLQHDRFKPPAFARAPAPRASSAAAAAETAANLEELRQKRLARFS